MRTTRSLVLSQLIRHALPILALCCLPVIKWNDWWWHIARRELLPAVLLIGAYGLSALLVAMFVRKHGFTAAARAAHHPERIRSLPILPAAPANRCA